MGTGDDLTELSEIALNKPSSSQLKEHQSGANGRSVWKLVDRDDDTPRYCDHTAQRDTGIALSSFITLVLTQLKRQTGSASARFQFWHDTKVSQHSSLISYFQVAR